MLPGVRNDAAIPECSSGPPARAVEHRACVARTVGADTRDLGDEVIGVEHPRHRSTDDRDTTHDVVRDSDGE